MAPSTLIILECLHYMLHPTVFWRQTMLKLPYKTISSYGQSNHTCPKCVAGFKPFEKDSGCKYWCILTCSHQLYCIKRKIAFFFISHSSFPNQIQISKKLNLKPTPPNLNKLKGSYQLDGQLREKLDIENHALTSTAKKRCNIKAVVDEYLGNAEIWEAEPDQFVLLLQTTIKKIIKYISKKADYATTNVELLLLQYLESLLKFYQQNPRIISDLRAYYRRKKLERRAKKNAQQARMQSSATKSAMVVEQSRQMEEGWKKRSYDSVENDDDLTLLTRIISM